MINVDYFDIFGANLTTTLKTENGLWYGKYFEISDLWSQFELEHQDHNI